MCAGFSPVEFTVEWLSTHIQISFRDVAFFREESQKLLIDKCMGTGLSAHWISACLALKISRERVEGHPSLYGLCLSLTLYSACPWTGTSFAFHCACLRTRSCFFQVIQSSRLNLQSFPLGLGEKLVYYTKENRVRYFYIEKDTKKRIFDS